MTIHKHCCDQMERMLTLNCDKHRNTHECPDVLVSYILKYDEYGLIIHDGSDSSISITFCPWCSSKLPESKRDLWFNELEKLGFDDPTTQEIPKEFLTDAWYKN